MHYLQNKDLLNSIGCFNPDNLSYSGFVITNAASYQKLADSLRLHLSNASCDTATMIAIDFTKYTLLGIKTTYGEGCTIDRSVIWDSDHTRISYNIDIRQTGMRHGILFIDLNYALIPRIPANSTVVFHVTKE